MVGWGESTLAITLFALNSWMCRVLTLGEDLLRNLVTLSLTLQTQVACLPNDHSLCLYWPQVSSQAKKGKQRSFPAQGAEVGSSLTIMGTPFLLPVTGVATGFWCHTGGWGPLEWDGTLEIAVSFFPQQRDKIWHWGSLNGEMDSTVNLVGTALISLVHARPQGPQGRSENWFS